MTKKFENARKVAWVAYGFDTQELKWTLIHYDTTRENVETRLQKSIENRNLTKDWSMFCIGKEETITTPVEYFDAKICYVKTPIDITK